MEMYLFIVGLITVLFYALFKGEKIREKNYNLERVPDNVKKWAPMVRKYASKFGVPFPVAMAVLWVESAGDPVARGSNSEKGLYQLKQIAVTDVRQSGYGDFYHFDLIPEQNIQAGIAYLDLQTMRTGSITEGIKAYNQGQKGAKENPVLADQYLRKVREKMKFFE